MAGQAAWLVLSLFSAPLFEMPAPTAHGEPGEAEVQPPSHQESCGMGSSCSACRCTRTSQPRGCRCGLLPSSPCTEHLHGYRGAQAWLQPSMMPCKKPPPTKAWPAVGIFLPRGLALPLSPAGLFCTQPGFCSGCVTLSSGSPSTCLAVFSLCHIFASLETSCCLATWIEIE